MLSCAGQLTLKPDKIIYNVNLGDNKNLTWNITGINNISDLGFRAWGFGPGATLLADIDAKGIVRKYNYSIIPTSGIEVNPPSTLMLKNVDHRYNGTYTFVVRLKLIISHVISRVEVFVTSKCFSFKSTQFCFRYLSK